jgi:glutaconate CoA-transferase, subunit A
MGRSPISQSTKETSLEEVAAAVPDGGTLGLGGWVFHNTPMALVRSLIRAGKTNLTLIPAPGSIGPDLLIGTGCVSTVFCVFIAMEHLGLAPHFRRAAESGALRVLEFDGLGLAAGLRAAADSLPWAPIHDLGTDLPRVNPEWYRPLPALHGLPAGGRLLAVPAIEPDVVLLHAQQGDYGGNCQLLGGAFFDPLLAQAGKKVFVSVDRLVDYDVIRRAPEKTKLPEFLVDGVVHAPYGAHPSGSQGLYRWDEWHFDYYLEATRTPEGLDRYRQMFVTDPGDHEAYLAAVGRDHLKDLQR